MHLKYGKEISNKSFDLTMYDTNLNLIQTIVYMVSRLLLVFLSHTVIYIFLKEVYYSWFFRSL